jgi:hypothetical protein
MLNAWSATIERLYAPAVPAIDWPPERCTRIDADGRPFRPKPTKVLKCPARRPRLDASVDALLEVIREAGIVTSAQLAARFGISCTTAVRRLGEMRRSGLVQAKSGAWQSL